MVSQFNFNDENSHKIIDIIDAGVYWKDKNGHILGCNNYVLKMTGIANKAQIIGKTDYDLWDKQDAEKLTATDLLAMNNGTYKSEECITLPNGIQNVYLSTKSSLLNEKDIIIGIIVVLVDITDQKKTFEQEKQQIISNEQMKFMQIVDVVNANIYWKDKNGHILGCNKYMLDMFGVNSRDQIIGKTDYDIYPQKIAQMISKTDMLVMQNGAHESEEYAILHGKERTFLSAKNRLLDKDGNVAGIVGASIDITDKKEAEQLKIENEKHAAIEEQQEKFKKIMDQVVHDIRSPIASMQMILPQCNKLPESKRVSLNKAASRIMDVANRLLNQVTPVKHDLNSNAIVPTLISSEILEVISEKRFEYKKRTIDFCVHICQNCYFVFLNTNPSDFKRMLSNLINNAVDAINDKIGKIALYLNVINNQLEIIVQDNGCGMPNDVKEKILNNIAVTSGKANGHGIGFSQIRDTMESSNGKLNIESNTGIGTKIILTFPQTDTPDWIAQKIELFDDDTIVILDDDESIHGAWETRFKKAAPNITRKHFEQGEEAIAFINNLEPAAKAKIFLLTDYELLDQGLHGLHVVKQTGISRSILVTSHHDSKEVRDLAKLHNTRILPKPLAPQIPIYISEQKAVSPHLTEKTNSHTQVDIVIADDDIEFTNNFVRFITSKKKTVNKYNSVSELMESISQYSKNTKLFIDNQFDKENITGIEAAQKLHNMGFSKLYLLSGKDYSHDSSIPTYLTPILKTNIDYILSILNG